MALDPHVIVKNDFAISRRGYEPEAVDKHLTHLAREVARLQFALDEAARSAVAAESGGTTVVGTLAGEASDHVRTIIEAAERSAEEIRRSAEEDAERTRASALSRSEEHVSSVGDATRTMRGRVDEMERELAEIVERLRAGADRLTSDLAILQDNLGEVYGGAVRSEPSAPRGGTSESGTELMIGEPVDAAAGEPVAFAAPAGEPEAATDEDPDSAAASIDHESGPGEPEPRTRRFQSSAERSSENSTDVEGARLIALNMALNGQSRDETDTYLRETFDLDDRDGLLDEVYATVAG